MVTSRFTRREFLRTMSLTAAGLTLVACAPPQPGAQAPAGEAGAEAPASAGEAITLQFWNESRGEDLEAFCQVGNRFKEQKPELNVTVECGGFDSLAKVAAAVSAGNPPDLVQSWERMNVPGMFQQGGVTALDSFIERDQFDPLIILPGAREGCRAHDGTYFAFPYMCYAGSDFFWNKKKFAEKGLDPEQPPKTLEELWEMGQLFDEYDGDKLMRIGFHPRYALNPEVWAFAFGAKFYDAETQQITPLDPGVLMGIEWLMQYAEKYGADQLDRLAAAYGQYQSANNPFLAGEVAMTSFWDAMPAYRDRYSPDVEMGFSPFPYPASMPEQAGFGKLDFNPCFIPKGTAHLDVAWELLKFIQQDIETNITVATHLANTPQNVNAITSPENTAGPLLKQVQEYAAGDKMQTFPPSIPVAAEYAAEWGRQLDLVFHGQLSYEEAGQKIIDVVQPELDKALHG